MQLSFEQRLAEKYTLLSTKLKQSGDFVAENPIDIATRSLRAVANDSGLAPATFSRLARALDYNSFEDLREELRSKIGQQVNSFADRAGRLQANHGEGPQKFAGAHLDACVENLRQLAESVDTNRVNDTVTELLKARSVLVLGALGSTGIGEYLSYLADYCTGNWNMAGRMGASLGSALAEICDRDALIIITKAPFSPKAILAAQEARSKGAFVVVITDTHACPALRHASVSFLVPTESPHFFSSYVATVALVETLIGTLVSRSGPEAQRRIAAVQYESRRLNEVLDGNQ